MKKLFKWVAIVITSLIVITVIIASVAIWVVFTPERITPIVRNQAAKFITCSHKIERVELTFFSTFPTFALKVNGIEIVNPMPKAPSDTLLAVDYFIGKFDFKAWWERNELVFTSVELANGNINAFVDSIGNANFNIFLTDTVPAPIDTTEAPLPFKFIDIRNIDLKKVSITYVDEQLKMNAAINNLTAQFSGFLQDDNLKTNILVKESEVSFAYENESYLTNAKIAMELPMEVDLAKTIITLGNTKASLNGIAFTLTGSVEDDAKNKQMVMNLKYSINPFSLANMLAMVPPSFQSYLDGLSANGIVSSTGTIVGNFSDTQMPLMNIKFDIKDGDVNYTELPLPLKKLNGQFEFNSDLSTDAITYFRIVNASAVTPRSSFKVQGTVKNLFSDIHCNLVTNANLTLSEFASFLPDGMQVKGKASGAVKTIFTLSQIDKMQLDRMRISGRIQLSDFDAVYDSMRLVTRSSLVDFSLPNLTPTGDRTNFLYAKVNAMQLEASMIDGPFAKMQDALLVIETSDVMDTTSLPNVKCMFAMDSLKAQMDTIRIAAFRPNGEFAMYTPKKSGTIGEVKLKYSGISLDAIAGTIASRLNNFHLNANVINPETQPSVNLTYVGEQMKVDLDDMAIRIASIDLSAKVANDTTQKDLLLQWPTNGHLKMGNGEISMAMLPFVVEIPSIKMDFDPETFNIHESRMIMGNSDFNLSGSLTNIFSYFKRDSLLVGKFKFESDKTDIIQLLALSNGMGSSEPQTSDTLVGPYMVPKGIDFHLNTSIKTATFGSDSATSVKGDVRLKDGLLVLDGLRFVTPGARVQMTAMYQTPRKNHLYLGLDYHMLDVEIDEVLNLFPMLDTIMPMLKSFKGKGEFHLAVETYTDSMYNPKKSTIRGASSLQGRDLVLMDSKTFGNIAKTLRFSKKAQNRVDSLNVEFTLFKEEIDVYPFLLSMDKYKAVISGRHNMDNSFSYHVSLVESPIPVKLGADISGTIDKLKILPAKCRYAEMYRPVVQGVVNKKQLELRKMIRESLTKKVIKD